MGSTEFYTSDSRISVRNARAHVARLRSALLAAATCLVASLATAGVVTFGTLPGPNGAAFSSVTEDGITVSSTTGTWQQGFNVGNPVPSIFTFSDSASITITTGSLFDFVSFDLGTGGAGGPAFTITEFLNNVLVFTLVGANADNLFHTITDGTNMLVDRVVITTSIVGRTTSANIDNIRTSTVPEPATLSLIGLALAGIALTRRRKSK